MAFTKGIYAGALRAGGLGYGIWRHASEMGLNQKYVRPGLAGIYGLSGGLMGGIEGAISDDSSFFGGFGKGALAGAWAGASRNPRTALSISAGMAAGTILPGLSIGGGGVLGGIGGGGWHGVQRYRAARNRGRGAGTSAWRAVEGLGRDTAKFFGASLRGNKPVS